MTAIRPVGSLHIRRRAVDPSAVDALPDSLHPVMRRVLAARQVIPDQLETPLSALLPVGPLAHLLSPPRGAPDRPFRRRPACQSHRPDAAADSLVLPVSRRPAGACRETA